ncbi:immunoglobulin-like domain-containing protein [Clostridium paraputrificum]|uniref:immunoglobulin-like domain-containing protein n=1 Tax=Clostridium paraputrificum TaxID=29363 RepID=UPI003D325988
MKKMKKSVKTAVVSTLVLSSTAAIAYAGSSISNKKNTDLENSLKLLVEQKDSDTVKVAIDNVKDIAKSMQFSIKLDGAKLIDGENSITDLVKPEVESRVNGINGTSNVITDYTYNEEKNTIDVLITSDSSLPKIGDKIDIFELDVKANENTEKADGDAPTFKVIPNNENSYKYVTNTNKEYNKIGVTYDIDQTIVMNAAPTISSNGKYIEILEGETLKLTADELGLTLNDNDGTDGLRLEVKLDNKGEAIAEFVGTIPGIYQLSCVAVDKYNAKSEAIEVQVNVKEDAVTDAPRITKKDGSDLEDIILRSGEEFKPLDDVKAMDAKGRDIEVEVSANEEINFDPEEDTDYVLTYKATDRYGNIGKKEVKLTILANSAPVITGVKDHKLAVGDFFDPRAGVEVKDEDENIELRVESNVNTKIVGTYQVSYSATDSAGKTTRAISKVVVNPKFSIINRAPEIHAEDKTITVGDSFDPREGVIATDKEDLELTHAIEVVQNNVDTKTPGRYTVTYSVTDSKGAKVTKTITVTVNPKSEIINSIPEINATDKTIKVGDNFDPLDGVTATDKEDDDLTLKIEVVENNVKTDKAGVYTVTYMVVDSQGAKAIKTITVTVNPKFSLINSAPKIEANNKTIFVGDKFDDTVALKDVTAEDKEDGNLTSEIKVIENNVDTSKAGVYTVKYSVTDSKGATTTKEITVVVLQKMEQINHVPEIKANDKIIRLGDEFNPLEGVSAYDYEDENITSSIKVVYNNVNSNKEGQYKVKYSVSDSEGATVTKEITVTVKKDIVLAESITINNKNNNKMYLENTKIISATINEQADIKDIDWTIDNESLASLEIVGNEAKIVAKAEGKVTVTASTKDGSNKTDSITIDIIDFAKDDKLPSYIKDVIDTNLLLPIAGTGTGEENSPLEFEVKNITASEVERLLEGLKDLSPVLEEIREENNSKIYKIKLTKKAGLFRYNDETYIEIRVSNKLDNSAEINKILAQLASEETDKPGTEDGSGSEETENSDEEDSVTEGNLKTGDTGVLGYLGVAAVAGVALLFGKKKKNR